MAAALRIDAPGDGAVEPADEVQPVRGIPVGIGDLEKVIPARFIKDGQRLPPA